MGFLKALVIALTFLVPKSLVYAQPPSSYGNNIEQCNSDCDSSHWFPVCVYGSGVSDSIDIGFFSNECYMGCYIPNSGYSSFTMRNVFFGESCAGITSETTFGADTCHDCSTIPANDNVPIFTYVKVAVVNNCDKPITLERIKYSYLDNLFECSITDMSTRIESGNSYDFYVDASEGMYTVKEVGNSKILSSSGQKYDKYFPLSGASGGESCDDGSSDEISFFDIAQTSDGVLFICSINPPTDNNPPPTDNNPPPTDNNPPPTDNNPPPTDNNPPPADNNPPTDNNPPADNNPPTDNPSPGKPPSTNNPSPGKPPSTNNPSPGKPPSTNNPSPGKPPSTNVDQDNQSSSSVPIGIIVGASVGGVVLIGAIIVGIWWCKKHRKNRMDPALDYIDNTAFGSPHAYITPAPVVASARVEQDQVISGSGHTVMNIA
ncbi:hypothetical protein PBCVCVG1_770L [Paramecium bursaria Chlorella virus CVG-1]|nr:hypothetical protein PBCVCVG1_770L [Paramecium bursaria Chlorella virus CVG-1]